MQIPCGSELARDGGLKYTKNMPGKMEIPMNAAIDVLQSTHQHINRDRLWQSLMDLAQLGATVKGGCADWP